MTGKLLGFCFTTTFEHCDIYTPYLMKMCSCQVQFELLLQKQAPVLPLVKFRSTAGSHQRIMVVIGHQVLPLFELENDQRK